MGKYLLNIGPNVTQYQLSYIHIVDISYCGVLILRKSPIKYSNVAYRIDNFKK